MTVIDMEITVLDKISNSCCFVSENSKHVRINLVRIQELVNSISFKELKHWLVNTPFGLFDLECEEIVDFLILFGSIDYSFWGEPKWKIESEYGNLDGVFALIFVLLKIRRDKGHLDFEKISYEETKDYFQGNILIPLFEERYNTLQEVSKIIKQKMNGSFYQYIKDISNDLDLINIIVDYFPSFNDVRTYQEEKIYFYKLAQLVVSDILHVRELKEGINVDYSHLVGCADYKIPQVLRDLGILEYDEELSSLIDNKIEILENSDYEIEIRANMIVAIEEIKNRLNDDIHSIDINDAIWLLGQDKTKKKKPYHLTRTTSY